MLPPFPQHIAVRQPDSPTTFPEASQTIKQRFPVRVFRHSRGNPALLQLSLSFCMCTAANTTRLGLLFGDESLPVRHILRNGIERWDTQKGLKGLTVCSHICSTRSTLRDRPKPQRGPSQKSKQQRPWQKHRTVLPHAASACKAELHKH